MKSNHFPLLKQTSKFVVLVVILSAKFIFAGQGNMQDSLRSKIDNIINDKSLNVCSIGIEVVDLNREKVLFSLNGDKLFHPASNQKLLTTAAAIELLPSKFQFKTIISTDGTINSGLIDGNLIIKGFGDPLFSNADLDSIVVKIQQLGIHRINGSIILDVSYFDSIKWGRGWMWDDEPDPTAPVISPISIDQNAVQITITTNMFLNKQPTIGFFPHSNYFSVINRAYTSNDTSLPYHTVSRIRGTDTILISGRISPDDSPQEFYLSIADPQKYFLHLLKERFITARIEVLSNTIELQPNKSHQLFILSHDIDSVLQQANKKSDNLCAENLLKTISMELLHKPGSTAEGINLLKGILYKSDIDTSLIFLADGSGASWYNAISPKSIVKLLSSEFKKTSFKRFFESLAIAGVDGTLKNRFKGTLAYNNVHAKTGTLTGNNCISGYLRTEDDEMLAFSILINHCPVEQQVMRNIEDRIIELLCGMRLK
ncbi:MAG: D-alanyl-D-alanine carboxypeptidase/D-alanyl-D-alanine-endopeptidase [Ignavibacteriales bacterium]|nr:D-alanyl-D-alanine carboxypeptidase/D-alanyl-D-alanine-endopeptidase [Ignavibacteriales bacterium]